ncbi:TIGR01777 family oxidoreductase [Propionibacteriaceae bacterium G57]|uniref:TIGR01777 family oxidoreductase n=1 Tax=Aestuariimicrobium sp. G57 TaxID=3418485 RepID=UPI003DA71A8D
MRVAITGATGLLGTATTQHLRQNGHTVIRLVRREPYGPDERRIDPPNRTIADPGLTDMDAVINFAGVGIADTRWTSDYKRKLRASRVATTQTIVNALADAPKCTTLLNGSAIGYYGSRGDEPLDEYSSKGTGFLADLVQDWEATADAAPEHVRVVKLRTGHVLTRTGGILGKQRLHFGLGLGGPIGDGTQVVSWIAVDDYVRAIEFLLTHDEISGPVNLTAPNPVDNTTFSKAFAAALHRPAYLPLPMFAPKLLFTAEMVDDAMLASQRALPKRLLDAGFTFEHTEVREAMRSVC